MNPPQGRQLFREIPRRPPRLPRIVTRRELSALLRRRMAVGPKLDKAIRSRIVEPDHRVAAERTHRRRLSVRNQSVNHLLAVDIGLMLDPAAEGVADRLGEEA